MRERHLIASFAIVRSILLDHYWFEDCIVLIEMLIETVDWIKIGNWEEFASRESEKECDDDDGIVAPLAAIPYLSILPFIFRIKRERERIDRRRMSEHLIRQQIADSNKTDMRFQIIN